MEQDMLASVRFVGSNGKSVTLPNIKVHLGPGPEDCDPHVSSLLQAMIINLLEKKDPVVFVNKMLEARACAAQDPKNPHPDSVCFHTVEIEDVFVSKDGWRSMAHSGLMDDYTLGRVG